MAFAQKRIAKDGKVYYRIRCKMRNGLPERSTRWYVPDGWSKKAIERELARQIAEFDRQCQSGEVLTRREQKEQQEQQERQKAEQEREEAEKGPSYTVSSYGNDVFMPYKATTLTENSRISFETMLRLHIYPFIGDKKISEVAPADIVALLSDVQSSRAHATAIKVYTVLSLLFKTAYLTDIIERNPMDKVERPRAKKDEKLITEVEAYTAEELRDIIKALQSEPLKWQCLVTLLIETGLRRGECVGLKWDDIDGTTITVKRTINYTPKAGVYEGMPKSGKTRTVYISESTAALLRRYHAEVKNSDYLFTQEGNKLPMHPQSPARYLQRFGERNGFDNLHPHKLRHSFASIAIQNGADIVSISEILGHADTAITLRVYSHASEESRKRAANILQDVLTSTPVNKQTPAAAHQAR